MTHTPEPWEYDERQTIIYSVAFSREPIAAPYSGNPEMHENAARIVACVNACAGLRNEELSLIGAVASGNAANNAHVLAERDCLAARVAEAQDALRYAADAIRKADYAAVASRIQQARAALAKGEQP